MLLSELSIALSTFLLFSWSAPDSLTARAVLAGRYRLVAIGGMPVPARTRAELADACWVETRSGYIEFRKDGTFADVEYWRGGCDPRGKQRALAGRWTRHADGGRYTLKPDSLRLYARDGGRWMESTSGLVHGDSVFTGYDEDQIERVYVRSRTHEKSRRH